MPATEQAVKNMDGRAVLYMLECMLRHVKCFFGSHAPLALIRVDRQELQAARSRPTPFPAPMSPSRILVPRSKNHQIPEKRESFPGALPLPRARPAFEC